MGATRARSRSGARTLGALVCLAGLLGCSEPDSPFETTYPAEPGPTGPAATPESRASGDPNGDLAGPPVAPATRTFAVLINGGAEPRVNFQSHLLHVHELMAYLEAEGIPRERIWVFSSDGLDPELDMAVKDLQPEENFWLIEGTLLGRNLQTELRYENSEIGGQLVRTATRRELMRFASKDAHARMRAGDTLLVYVTDHGQVNQGNFRNNRINLWHEELSVDEFRQWLALLPEGVRVVSLMSQCFSGGFVHAMYDADQPEGRVRNSCGYFSSSAKRPAYGCYPQNRGKDNVGHSFRFFEGLRVHGNMPEAHARVLLTDRTPDVPNRTSDHFLAMTLRHAAKELGTTRVELVDQILLQVDPEQEPHASLFAQVDHIGKAFGSFSPRSLAELKEKARALPELRRELGSYTQRWNLTLNDLRRENVAAFLKVFAGYREYQRPKYVKEMPNDEKRRLARALLADMAAFIDTLPERRQRLEALHLIASEAERAKYRMAVRQAVVLRLRSLLMRIAGLYYLEKSASPELRARLEELIACEALAFRGSTVVSDEERRLPPPFPELEDEHVLLASVLPGWLGIAYKPLSQQDRRELGLELGAVLVDRIVSDSPASEAGLRIGDILIGPPGRPFEERNQVREWVMTTVVGEQRSLELLRDGEPFVLTVIIGQAPL